jgi:putative peptidoglycan lipid II flippase
MSKHRRAVPADSDPVVARTDEGASEQQSVLRNSAVMAAGTLVSRASGFVRSALLAAALGNSIHADVFNIANTIPNMLYILLAGGVVNAVLVPQLVRSLKNDADGGQAYTSRVITLVGVFLIGMTVLLMLTAQWWMRIFVSDDWSRASYDSAVTLAVYCLPQVFFYGMFVLVGQVLNSRRYFGPMMWAPIANNVLSIAMLVAYLFVFGDDDPLSGPFSSGRALLIGVGSTLGIVAQLLVLLPYLRAAGISLRPRFDFRGSGLSHTLRLGVWTVLFVIANQVAYGVVVRLAGSGTAHHTPDGTGYTVYTSTFLMIMVPHAIITVSLATAILPRLSAHAEAGDRRAVARTLAPALRTALAVMIPFAALLTVVGGPAAHVLWGYGAAKDHVDNYVPTLVLFGPGLIFFTVHYLLLRGFYAREENRTVFYIQCVVASVNIVAALALVGLTSDKATAPALAVAYALAYAVGSALSYSTLSRRIGGLKTRTLLRFLIRMVVVVAATVAVVFAFVELVPGMSDAYGVIGSAVQCAVIGAVALVVLVPLARAMRITEVTDVVDTLTRRLGR